uniref:(California timema) hypothetical protein n=1 Tax=Timema californicum TaxID=61474 RepID=A0A7R9JHU7_TIMCA|nr:unnamed protein product [Timema californicum]
MRVLAGTKEARGEVRSTANGRLNRLTEMDSQSKDAQVFMVVVKLIEAAADKEETVREAVMASLRKLSKKHPSEVLRHAVDYRKRNAKAPPVVDLSTTLSVSLGAGPHTTEDYSVRSELNEADVTHEGG